jgi:hypothetical protein
MKISENTSVSLPIRNLLAIVAAVAIGVWAYFGIIERITLLETADKLQEQDLLEASAQKPIDQEQFMLLEHMAEQLETDVERLRIDVEKLKDSVRANLGKLNGDH